MKITINRQSFLAAFQLAASVATDKSTKPILASVKLEVTEEGSTLIATDLETGVRVKLDGLEFDEPGEVMLPVKRIAAILRECDDDKLTLKSDGMKTVIQSTQSKFNLTTQDPAEFPSVAQFDSEQYHEIKAADLCTMLGQVSFAADTGLTTRFAMGGALLTLVGDEATVVATDGKRLAVRNLDATGVGGHVTTGTNVIPLKSVGLIRRAMDGSADVARVFIDAGTLLVQSDSVTLTTRMIEGRFPNWSQVFPTEDGSTKLDLPVGEFHSAVRQSAIMTATEENEKVSMKFTQKGIEFRAEGAEVGDSTTTLECSCTIDEPVTIVVSPLFLSEFLKGLDQSGTFSLRFTDGSTAVVCSIGDDYQYVVMPLSVS